MTLPHDSLDALAEQIADRGERLRARIDSMADHPVRMVAVTKGHPTEVVEATRRAGFADVGENYAQELRSKVEELGAAAPGLADVAWHFIGRLQSNKVRLIAADVALWQSVDRESVVSAIARRAPGAHVLVQVDLAGIAGRGGCSRSDVGPLVEAADASGLVVDGLMGVGLPGDPELSRPSFRWLRDEAVHLGLQVVSMGMSGDLDVAVQEGSTMVRVGSALVGPRPNNPMPPGTTS